MKCSDKECGATFTVEEASQDVSIDAEEERMSDGDNVEIRLDVQVTLSCPECGEEIANGSGETVATVETKGSWDKEVD